MRAAGNDFYTQSGSHYRLGEVDITFKNSMVEEGIWEEEDSLHHLLESDYKPVYVPPPAVRELLNSQCLTFCPLRHVFHTIGREQLASNVVFRALLQAPHVVNLGHVEGHSRRQLFT